MTIDFGSSAAIGLIVAGSIIDIATIALLVRRGQRGKTAGQRDTVPWPLAAVLVLGFVVILFGVGALG